MGCDIHNHIEYKRTVNGEEKWFCGDYFKVNPYYERGDKYERKLELVPFCENRNYGLFSLLADVRNYGGNEPISQPRKLPKDLSKEVKADARRWGIDGHSHSYFTLQELIKYESTHKTIKESGYISPKSAELLDNYGIPPEEWCQWTSIESWVYREWQRSDNSIANLIEEMKKRAAELYVIYKYMWEQEPEEAYKRAENIRIVFWFDN